MRRPLTIAVTGMNATDNPAPGVAVVRAIRAAAGADVTVVGLGYDTLDPGHYMGGICDHSYLLPYPSQGTQVMYDRLCHIQRQTPIDVLVPTLDAELSTLLKLEGRLNALGIKMFVPDEERLSMRSKHRLNELRDELEISVPKSMALVETKEIAKIQDEMKYPVMVKGQFYDAYIAYSPLDVQTRFNQLASKWGVPVIVQEFVAGDEYCVVCLGDGEGGLVGSVPMRKMQLTDKGKAWGGVTVADRQLDEFVKHTMSRLKWRGPCEMEIMKSRDTGELYIIEINPRFPAWVYLSVGAGRNLPWATVQLALGEDVEPMAPAPSGVMFLRHSVDQICSMEDFQALTTVGEVHRTPVAPAPLVAAGPFAHSAAAPPSLGHAGPHSILETPARPFGTAHLALNATEMNR